MSISPVLVNGMQDPLNDYYSMQKKAAENFVNAGDRAVSKMASGQYEAIYGEEDRKFGKNTNKIINSTPLLAVAAGLASKKGLNTSLKDGAGWGIALLAPQLTGSINKKAIQASPELKKAEKNHPGLTLAGGVAASIGAYFGGNALLNKAVSLPKVQETAKNIADKSKQLFNNIKNPIQLTPEANQKLADLKSKVKPPEFIKPVIDKAKNSEILKKTANTALKIGKKVLKNAPAIAVLGTAAAIIGKSADNSNKYNKIKTDIKNSQLETARTLINE